MKFEILFNLIKESINPINIKYDKKYLGNYVTKKDDNFNYNFNIQLSGHSIDQFDFRRKKTNNVFKDLNLEDGIKLFKQKIIKSIDKLISDDYLKNIKYRSEQSFLIYCKISYLGYIMVVKNNGGNNFNCVVVTTFYFDKNPPISTNESDQCINLLTENNKNFNTVYVEI